MDVLMGSDPLCGRQLTLMSSARPQTKRRGVVPPMTVVPLAVTLSTTSTAARYRESRMDGDGIDT
jgi:hypothetical protein